MRALTGRDARVTCQRCTVGGSRSISWTSVPQSDLVPGDVIKITSDGDIPADCIIVSGSVLVDESMLTGESLPLSKCAPEVFDETLYDSIAMKKCSLFCGSMCKSSRGAGDCEDCAVAVVMRTGMQSHKGDGLDNYLITQHETQ
jgi:magnesium-transporting ATPase (P-type)